MGAGVGGVTAGAVGAAGVGGVTVGAAGAAGAGAETGAADAENSRSNWVSSPETRDICRARASNSCESRLITAWCDSVMVTHPAHECRESDE